MECDPGCDGYVDIEDYKIIEYGDQVRKKLAYNVYKIPIELLIECKATTKDFNENVGYHN
jgi:hypothetical protein